MSVPQRIDSARGRFYRVEGRELPSVTHILSCLNKPALVIWSANQERAAVMEAAADLYETQLDAREVWPRSVYLATLQSQIGRAKAHQKTLATAQEIGSQAHALIEWRVRRMMGQMVGPEPSAVEPAQWAVMAWEDWARAVALRPVRCEQMVYSLTHGYAGTMDLLAHVEGQLTLIDMKTGKSIYPEAHLQTAAYRHALCEMMLIPTAMHSPLAGLIVRLPKVMTDPAFEVVPSPPMADLLPAFLSILETWRWWHATQEADRAAYQARKRAG